VAGARELDRKYEDEARRSFRKWEGQLEFCYLSEVPLQKILDTVSTAPPGTIVLLMNSLILLGACSGAGAITAALRGPGRVAKPASGSGLYRSLYHRQCSAHDLGAGHGSHDDID